MRLELMTFPLVFLHETIQSTKACISAGVVCHCNEPEHYHVTVQMISHPSDPRPDAFREGGGLVHALDHHWVPRPLESNLQKERNIYSDTAKEFAVPELQVSAQVTK